MPELTGGPDLWTVARNNCEGVFLTCVRPDLHLVQWTWHLVEPSHFLAADTVHSSGCRLQLASQLFSLTSSLIKMIQPMGDFLNCAKLINHWPDITSKEKDERHYK